MDYVEIPILDAAIRCGIAVDRNSYKVEVEANCPFCEDRKKHLSFNTLKNQFRCNRCGEWGNSITLFAKLYQVNNKVAYKELISGTSCRDLVYEKRNRIPIPQREMKPLAQRHDVYYDMLQMLELSSVHKQNLMERGLDGTAIEWNMYRTVPQTDTKVYSYMMQCLSKEHDLAGIPGFYLQNGTWQMMLQSGMFVPVCNHQGYIQGLQIRLDHAAKRKYRWFSSNHFQGGTKSIPWIHVANWNNSNTVYVTEGALKSEVASYLMGNACIIGLAGINCTQGLIELLHELHVTEVVESLDMDKFTNPYVAKALVSLKNSLLQAGIKYASYTWNPLYKGIDDYCLAVYKNDIAA